MRILFVAARLPYPPLSGDQVRAFHQLRLLGRQHEITLLSFTRGKPSPEAISRLAPFCRRIVTVPHHGIRRWIGCLRGRLSSYPIQTLFHQSRQMSRAVQTELSARAFDLVHVQLVRMAPYFEAMSDVPRVIDLIDALSLNMERRHQRQRGLLKLAVRVERDRLSAYERAVCSMYDRAAVVSSLDQAAIGDFPNLHTVPNGVDLGQFAFRRGERHDHVIMFGGNMGYFPNVDAVKWFVREVFPLIRRRVPTAQFQIVGVNPHRDVRQLANLDPAVTVTGYVKDMHARLNESVVAVVPLRCGSGMQSKVVEAMASGTPLVVTSFALGGIDALDGHHLLIANQPQAFASHVIRLLKQGDLRDTLAANARRLVEQRYTWERSTQMLEQIYSLALAAHSPQKAVVRRAA